MGYVLFNECINDIHVMSTLNSIYILGLYIGHNIIMLAIITVNVLHW